MILCNYVQFYKNSVQFKEESDQNYSDSYKTQHLLILNQHLGSFNNITLKNSAISLFFQLVFPLKPACS